MPKKRRMTPQEKKRLSLKKDRRNVYGESDKASRKAIPLQKAKANRRVRRGLKTAMDGGADDVDGVVLALDRARWRKVPDAALGEMVRTGPEKHDRDFRARKKRHGKA